MIDIRTIPTVPPKDADKKALKEATKKYVERLGDLQQLMFAEGKHSLLILFQGMDASGKDGAVRKVFDDVHPSGVEIFSYKKPTEEEFAHDFLWRIHKNTPAKGMIHVFNRSHYEDVLIQRVHGWIDEERVEKRMNAINAFEELLQFDNNTHVVKFYLHLSKDQQKEELQQRIDEQEKHWKHNDNDWKEREHWEKYMDCYNDIINNTSIPWHIVPVDNRWYRDYVVSKYLVEYLETLKMEWPALES